MRHHILVKWKEGCKPGLEPIRELFQETLAIPGVETQNAAFFAAHGMSFFAQNPDEAARFADRLIFDAKARERMLAAQNAELPKDAAARIAASLEHS